ncbi:MAG: hypothetical protein U9Q20_06510 [Campylobacterota bacterium]|nr:hypothetical protein [Campylobacterota bacterium]
MNKINPITVLLLSITIFLSSITLLKDSNKELKDSNKELKEFVSLSSKYNTLKTSWDKKVKTIDLIDKIIKSTRIKNIDKKVEKKKIIIKFENNSPRDTDKFVNKILNEKINIEKLNITSSSVELVVGY